MYLARRQFELHSHACVVQQLLQLLQRIVHALVRDGACNRRASSLRNGNKGGSIEGRSVAVVVTELHDTTSAVQREDVRAVGKMIAVTNVTKRQPHAAEHSESVGVLPAHALGHSETVDEGGEPAAVAAADAVKNLQARNVLIVSTIGVRWNVQVRVPERAHIRTQAVSVGAGLTQGRP